MSIVPAIVAIAVDFGIFIRSVPRKTSHTSSDPAFEKAFCQYFPAACIIDFIENKEISSENPFQGGPRGGKTFLQRMPDFYPIGELNKRKTRVFVRDGGAGCCCFQWSEMETGAVGRHVTREGGL